MARFRITQWNSRRLLERPGLILREYGPVIGDEMKRQMATVQFRWPTNTLRFTSLFMPGFKQRGPGQFSPPTTQAGARNTARFKFESQETLISGKGIFIPKGLRDAVDTGELLNSQTLPVVTQNGSATRLRIGWTAPYAATVLYGGDYGSYINVNGAFVDVGQKPGRDWISPALQLYPLRPFFINRWRQLSARGGPVRTG